MKGVRQLAFQDFSGRFPAIILVGVNDSQQSFWLGLNCINKTEALFLRVNRILTGDSSPARRSSKSNYKQIASDHYVRLIDPKAVLLQSCCPDKKQCCLKAKLKGPVSLSYVVQYSTQFRLLVFISVFCPVVDSCYCPPTCAVCL